MECATDASARGQGHQHRRHRHPGALAVAQQREEVGGVLGDQRSGVVSGEGEHIGIRGSAETDGANMHPIVAPTDEQLRHPLAVHLIEEEPQPATMAERAADSLRTRVTAFSFS